MSGITARQGLSDSQANAQALARRDAPWTGASEASFRVQWDFHRREPSDLREAVRMVRRAYADEVPTKLHEGPDAIGEGGTPKMTARAEGYIMGSAEGSDATRDPETGELPLLSYYHAPFRATLSRWERGSPTQRRFAAIVAHVTIGSQPPVAAALAVHAHPLDAKDVAERALRSFLRSMTDLKLHVAKDAEAA